MAEQKSWLQKAIFAVVFLFVVSGILAYSSVFINIATAASTSIVLSAKTTPDKLECKIISGGTSCGQVSLLASVPFPSGYSSVVGYFQYSTDGKTWKKVSPVGFALSTKITSTQSSSMPIIAAGKYQYKVCLFSSATSTKIIKCSNTVTVTAVAAPLSVDATVTPIQAYCDSLGKCEPVNVKVTGIDITYGISNIILYSIANDGVTKTKEAEQSCSGKKECFLEKSVSKSNRGGYKYFAEVFNTHKTTSNPLGDKVTKDIMVQIGKDDPPTAVGNIVIIPDKGEIAANDKISITLKAKDDVGLTIGKITFSKMGHEAEFREISGFNSIDAKGLKEFNFLWNNEFPGWKVDADKDTSGVYNIKIAFRDTNPNNMEGYSAGSGAITIADEFVAKLRKLGISNEDIGAKNGPSGSILGYMATYGIASEEMLPVAVKLLNMIQQDKSDAVVDPLAQIKGLLVVYRGAKSNLLPANDSSSISVDLVISALKNVEIKIGTNSKAVENCIKAVPGVVCTLVGGLGNLFSFGALGTVADTVLREQIKKGTTFLGNATAKVWKSATSAKIDLNNPRSESDVVKNISLNGNYIISKAEYASSYYLFSSIGVIKNGNLDTTKIKHSTPAKNDVGTVLGDNGYRWNDKIFLPRDRAWLLEWSANRNFDVLGLAKGVDPKTFYAPLIQKYRAQTSNGLMQFTNGTIDVNQAINPVLPQQQ